MQATSTVKSTYEETKETIRLRLRTAERLTNFFNSSGIRGKDRDFSNYVDASLSALDVFDRLRGLVLNHSWNTIE